MNTSHPHHWIKKVTSIALKGQDISMWGAFPTFPWESFSETLSSQLGIHPLNISAKEANWKEGSEILHGMGSSFLHIAVELAPIRGYFFLVFPIEDFSKFSAWTIHTNGKNVSFYDSSLQKGFFRYLCAESLEILEKMAVFPHLRPRLLETSFVEEDAYCVEIAIEKKEQTVWARAIFPTLFQQSFKEHYAQDWNLSFPSTLYPIVFTNLSLCTGHVTLSETDLNQIEPGDFLLLDSCSYSPLSKKGTFQLELGQIPLFQTKIKEESIKILDYADYFEDHTRMNDEYDKGFFEDELEEKTPITSSEEEALISPKKVPITLTVEVAQLKMSLDRLLKLKPGNVLELTVQIEKGVNLVANGQCIGKGELLQVEDVIGVKITKLGQ